jgi:hypothetical protein
LSKSSPDKGFVGFEGFVSAACVKIRFSGELSFPNKSERLLCESFKTYKTFKTHPSFIYFTVHWSRVVPTKPTKPFWASKGVFTHAPEQATPG